MLIKLEAHNRQPDKQLADKWKNMVTAKKYMGNGKAATVCKCPKCGAHHETRIQWTGRGIPRIYCTNCKPIIAAIDSINNHAGTGSVVRRTRKNAKNVYE